MRFPLCQAGAHCVECAPFPASHLDHAVGNPTVSNFNTPWASETHDSKAQAPHCSCLEKAAAEEGCEACTCHDFFERKGGACRRAESEACRETCRSEEAAREGQDD